MMSFLTARSDNDDESRGGQSTIMSTAEQSAESTTRVLEIVYAGSCVGLHTTGSQELWARGSTIEEVRRAGCVQVWTGP